MSAPVGHRITTGMHRRGIILLAFGIAFLAISIPLLIGLLSADLARISGWVGPIPVVDPSFVQVSGPPLGHDVDTAFEAWLFDLMRNFLVLAVTAAYYLTVLMLLCGVVFVGFGASFLNRMRVLAAFTRLSPTMKAAFIVLSASIALYGLIMLVFGDPTTRRLLVELIIAIGIGGTLFLLLASAWFSLYEDATPTVRIVAIYPLGIGAIVLPIVIAGLISPTFSIPIRVMSERIAILLLDTILAVGGVNAWLRATFDLEGLGYLAFWLVIVVLLGWVVGLAFAGLDRLRR